MPAQHLASGLPVFYDPAFLVHAWERVSTNKGARTAGIDKATAAMIENGVGVGAFLGQIRDSLKTGEFRPDEVRRVMVTKGNTGKFRKLGIPTGRGGGGKRGRRRESRRGGHRRPGGPGKPETGARAHLRGGFQAVLVWVRPNRRAQRNCQIHHFASESINYRWVFETDIKACFEKLVILL